MANLAVKKRHKKTKQSGNNNNGKTCNSEKQILAAIKIALEDCTDEILAVAKRSYAIAGRGCVNISVKNHPNHPYKRGYYYFVTEEENKAIQSRQAFVTEDDRRIAESIASYDPSTQAVVMVWHGTMYYFTIIVDKFALFQPFLDTKSFAVH